MNKNPHRETELFYENVILGSSVEAMMAAYVHQIPIFGNSKHAPLPFYYLPSELDLSHLHIENTKTLHTRLSGKEEYFGMQRLELWNTALHRLSIMGLAPMFGEYYFDYWKDMQLLSKMRKTNEFSISVKNKIVNIHAENVIVFDHPAFNNGEIMYMVNDYLKVKNIKELKADIITDVVPIPEFLSTMCYESVLYKERKSTYCCVKSIISENSFDEWENTQTSIRLKTEKSLYWNMDKAVKVEVDRREVSPILKPMYPSLLEIIHMNVVDQEML